ncbi:uncharacterized protein LOC124163806 [Ischnura elegans]|uniref:uncharacterized protein LOC124163806 n=1 Tax=Ischnura elegans TaxID=197161 RepID=UPI001ED8A827|nr:uncharacterized protein LOC124163806 [Ischnura elegans]
MESPAGTGITSPLCVSKFTPGRKTPSSWKRMASPYAVYTSTPVNPPSPSCLLQLLEWEASAVLADSRPSTPLSLRSPNVRTPGRSLSPTYKTPTAANSPFFRRRINRRILDTSTDPSEVSNVANPLSPATSQSSSSGDKAIFSSVQKPVRSIQRQRAMVKRFMVTKKRLSQCKIVRDNRGGLRL